MKHYLGKLILAVTLISTSTLSFGQYCNNFHLSYCQRSEDDMFKLNGQSKSALFSKGQTSDLNIVVYKGQDYRISLCIDENLGSQVKFKIYETVKKKLEKVIETKAMESEYKKCNACNGTGEKDGDMCYDCQGVGKVETGEEVEVVSKETKLVEERVKQLLYDNTTDNNSTEIEFSVESTRRLTIEISIPGSSDGGGNATSKGKIMKSEDMGCVGVLVEHMTTPISGFYGTGF